MSLSRIVPVSRLKYGEQKHNRIKEIRQNWELYLIILVPFLYIIIFKYVPMYGAQIAFRNFNIVEGLWNSPWVGTKFFIRFLSSFNFKEIFLNTLTLSIYSLVAGFPIPIILALLLNYCNNKAYKSIVQMTTYAPHFISQVVLVGMVMQFLSPRNGIVNSIITLMGGKSVNFMGIPESFSSVYVWSGIWQNAGWGTIIYIAALSAISPELHESAIIDGASKLQRIRYIDIPGIMPTIVILLIMDFGHIMDVGFEKVLLLQNPINLHKAEVIQTYVYKVGLASSLPNYSYSTAIGLFLSVINFILLMVVNQIAKKIGETSLW